MDEKIAVESKELGKWKIWLESVKVKWKYYFEVYTGHSAKCFESVENFVAFMYQPTDAASLGVGRMLFGKEALW